MDNVGLFSRLAEDSLARVEAIAARPRSRPTVEEIGIVRGVGDGVAHIRGLPGVFASEVLVFPTGEWASAIELGRAEVGAVLLDRYDRIRAGTYVRRTGRVLDVPVGRELLGRVVDGVGRPLDGKGPIAATRRLPIEREAPAIIDRLPVTVPLQTGIKVVDALIPIGRGQRQLVVGDRQTGKTAICVNAILNQKDTGVLCIYCAIGQRATSTARVLADLEEHGALAYTIVVATTEDDPPGLQFATPYAAMSMAEHFMYEGHDVLVVLDDLTRHARAYREIALLLRRPPGREAYPGDIFYIHSRLLERSTHLRGSARDGRKPLHGEGHGGGSITALPVCETEAGNISGYIPTNLISITDGQLYLSPELFYKGILPAVDVGKSVSRVGGKAQLPAYRGLIADLRLTYSQFEELEAFARFGTRLDAETMRTLERGRRVREALKQEQYRHLTVPEQIAVLYAVSTGTFDAIPVERIGEAEQRLCEIVDQQLAEFAHRISAGGEVQEEDRRRILEAARSVVQGMGAGDGHARGP